MICESSRVRDIREPTCNNKKPVLLWTSEMLGLISSRPHGRDAPALLLVAQHTEFTSRGCAELSHENVLLTTCKASNCVTQNRYRSYSHLVPYTRPHLR